MMKILHPFNHMGSEISLMTGIEGTRVHSSESEFDENDELINIKFTHTYYWITICILGFGVFFTIGDKDDKEEKENNDKEASKETSGDI